VTSFLWWANQASEGHFMCGLCVEEKPVAEAWVDAAGDKWDVCQKCHELDQEALRRREQRRAS
jgi:hypothetical protein